MQSRTKWLLAAMMFLQYAVWGAWTPILGATLTSRMHAKGTEIGMIYGVLWLACIITPFIGGQLVDRLMSSQVYLGLAAIVCTVSAAMMSQQQTIGGLANWMWVWSLAFAPTLGIANAIVFYHLGKERTSATQQERDFSVIRTAGTVGWIVAGILLTVYLNQHTNLPKDKWVPFEEMQLTAVFGALWAIVCFLLPNTPPSKDVKDPWAFTRSFSLFKTVPGFLVFILISFVVSTEFQFFYVLSAPFLETLGIDHKWVPITKALSQVAEIVSLAFFLPLSLKYLGMRATLVIGTLAWPLRYFMFAMHSSFGALGTPLVIFSLMFHGIGFAFVFVTSYIYIDRVAPRDIRASAQSLFTLITLGIGNYLGTAFCGWLQEHYTVQGVTNWPMVFIVPGVMTVVCGLLFGATFREPTLPPAELPTDQEVDDLHKEFRASVP